MNTRLHPVVAAVLVAALSLGVVACEKKGPAERAGEKIDKAATDAGNAIEDKCEKVKEGMGAKDPDC